VSDAVTPQFREPAPAAPARRLLQPGPTFPTHIRTEFVLVTPELARRYLKAMHANRSKSKLGVEVMEDNLRQDVWFPAISPVYFDDRDRPWDGQHRFEAIAKSGIAAYLLFIRGVTAEEADYIDTGRARMYSDTLRMNGVNDYKRRAVLARALALYTKYGIEGTRVPGSHAITRPEMDAWLEAPGVTEALRMGEQMYRAVHANQSLVAYAVMRTGQRHPDGTMKLDPDGFWANVAGADGLFRGDPAKTLHDWLLMGASRDRRPADKRLMELYALATSWNKHVQGRSYMRVNPVFEERAGGKKVFPAANVPDFLPLPDKPRDIAALKEAFANLKK
jgi:hypothetical protein